jgi:hypothetical protein
MFASCGHTSSGSLTGIAAAAVLQAMDIGITKLSGEMWTFAEIFFDTAPSQFAWEIQDRGKNVVDPKPFSFSCDDIGSIMN